MRSPQLAIIAVASLVASACATRQTFAPPSNAQTVSELPRIAQALMDAVATGDTVLWGARLSPDVLLTDENGDTRTRAQFLATVHPLPPTSSGVIRVANAQVRVADATAVLTYDALESERYFGQPLDTRYHTTDTFVWRGDRWLIIAEQTQVLPSIRKAGAWQPDADARRAYVGRYLLAPSTICTITDSANVLWTRTGARPAEPLLPSTPDVFVRTSAPRGERVFVHDASGAVTRMLDRRDNNDVVWMRVPQ